MLLFVLTQDRVQAAELEDTHIWPHWVKHKLSLVRVWLCRGYTKDCLNFYVETQYMKINISALLLHSNCCACASYTIVCLSFIIFCCIVLFQLNPICKTELHMWSYMSPRLFHFVWVLFCSFENVFWGKSRNLNMFLMFSLCPFCVSDKHAQLLLNSNLLYSAEIVSVLIQTPNCCTPWFSPTGTVITSHILHSGLLLGSLTSLTFPWEIHFYPARLLCEICLRKEKHAWIISLMNSCLAQPVRFHVLHKKKWCMGI